MVGIIGRKVSEPISLCYLRARYYDPASGQFLSRDPLVSLTREPYGYVVDNPLNGTDASGMICLFASEGGQGGEDQLGGGGATGEGGTGAAMSTWG